MNVIGAAVRPGDGHTSVVLGEDDAVLRFPGELYDRVAEHRCGADGLAVGVRPEGVLVARQATDDYIPVEAHIIERLGPYDIVDLKFGRQLVRARTASGYVERPGDVLWARFDEKQTHVFDVRTGESLRIRL
jgi:multiple sugar transport system ATP-binding protein